MANTYEPTDGDDVDGPVADPRVLRTRKKVLATAYALLTEIGFGNITIDDISDRSGVSRSTLYRHWRTRDDILRDAFSSLALGPDDDERDLREGLRRYAQVVAHGLRSVWGRAAVTLAVEALDDPEQRVAHHTFVDGMRRDVHTLLDRALRRGELTVAADVDDVASQLLAPLFFDYLFGTGTVDDDLAIHHADRVFEALTAPEPPTRDEPADRWTASG